MLPTWLSRLFRNNRSVAEPARRLPSHLFRNAVEIDDEAEWVRIVPIGNYPMHHDGAHEITRVHLEQMAANFERSQTDLLFDVDHQSLWGHTRAAAWSNELEVRDDGLYCRRPELTTYGEQAVNSREYRYYSPVYALNWTDKQGNPVGAVIDSVAFTNRPYFDEGEIDTIGNSQQPNAERLMDREEIIQIYGLSADATDEQIKEAMTNSKAALDAQPNPETPPAPAPDPVEPEPADEAAKVNSRIAKLEQQLADREKADVATRAETLVNAAVAEGKILPADKQVWLNAATADFEGTKTTLDARKRNSALAGRAKVPTKPAVNAAAGTVPADVAQYVNQQCGVA